MMLLLELFWSFVKIGFTSFGGLSDIVAIAEMTPGPLGLNCATFAGMRAAGILGAFVANMGALSPTYTLCAVAAVFFEHFRDNKRLGEIMTGVRPACVGMVAGVVVDLVLVNYAEAGRIHFPSVILGAVDLILLLKFHVSIPKVLMLSAIAGVIMFGVIGL